MTTLPQTAASFLHGQLRWFTERGVNITLISSYSKQLPEFADAEGIAWRSAKLTRAIAPMHDAAAVCEMARHFTSIRPHIVHAHTPKAGLISMLAARSAGVPRKIYHLHGLRYETTRGPKRWLLKAVERLSCQLATRVLCVSPSLREVAIREGIIQASRSQVLCQGSVNGIAVDEFDYLDEQDRHAARITTRQRLGIPTNAPCIGFMGRLVRDKGIEELAACWGAIRDRHPTSHLLLVGPFEREDPVRPDVRKQLESDPRVHLTGLNWNCRPYFAAMDVFTLPSHREGLGHVLLEAAAMGLPSVSCRVTGCVDAIEHNRTGILVAPKSPRALELALEKYLDSPELRWVHGQQAKLRARKRFQPQRIWEAQADVYAHLLAKSFSNQRRAKAA